MPIDYKAVGSRIAYYRKLNRLTAADLASQVEGLTRDNLAKIETGDRKSIDVGMLLDIANALGVPHLALLLDLTEPDAPSGITPGMDPSLGPDLDATGRGYRPMAGFEAFSWECFEPLAIRAVAGFSEATKVAFRRANMMRRLRRAAMQFSLAKHPTTDSQQSEGEYERAVEGLWVAYREARALGLNAAPPQVPEPDIDYERDIAIARALFGPGLDD